MKAWFERFRRSLGFWSLHCVVSALPGFCIAMWLVGFSRNPVAPPAMLSALFTMILLLTSIMSIWPTLTDWRTLPSRGLRVGLQLRFICSVASLIVLGVVLASEGGDGHAILILMPDLWTGLGAVLSISLLSEPFGYGNPVSDVMDDSSDLGFAMIYLIALIDGLILCFMIFIVSFVSMLVLQIRDRKRFYQDGSAYGLWHRACEVGRLRIPQGKAQEAEEQG